MSADSEKCAAYSFHIIIIIIIAITEQNEDSQRNTVQLLTGPVIPSFARLCPAFLCSQRQKQTRHSLCVKYGALSMNARKKRFNEM